MVFNSVYFSVFLLLFETFLYEISSHLLCLVKRSLAEFTFRLIVHPPCSNNGLFSLKTCMQEAEALGGRTE